MKHLSSAPLFLRFLSLSVAALLSLSGAEKTRITVNDLKTVGGVPSDLAVIASDALRDGLARTRRFTLVDLKNLPNVQAEQARQQTGCTERACAVKLGNLLNVQKIVVGSISRVGESFELRISFIDVELGQVEFPQDIRCNNADQVAKAAEALAQSIGSRMAISGKILSAEGGDEFLINLGKEDDLQPGQELKVRRLGEPITDDETGESYGRRQVEVGTAKVVQVIDNRLAKIKTKSKKQDFQKNDRVVIEAKEIAAKDIKGEGAGNSPDAPRESKYSINLSVWGGMGFVNNVSGSHTLNYVSTLQQVFNRDDNFGFSTSLTNSDLAVRLVLGPVFASYGLFASSTGGAASLTGVRQKGTTNELTYSASSDALNVLDSRSEIKLGFYTPLKKNRGANTAYAILKTHAVTVSADPLHWGSNGSPFLATSNPRVALLNQDVTTNWNATGFGLGNESTLNIPFSRDFGLTIPVGLNFVAYPINLFTATSSNQTAARFITTGTDFTRFSLGLGANIGVNFRYNLGRFSFLGGAYGMVDWMGLNQTYTPPGNLLGTLTSGYNAYDGLLTWSVGVRVGVMFDFLNALTF